MKQVIFLFVFALSGVMSNVFAQEQKQFTNEQVEEYFMQFLNKKDNALLDLFLQHQPSLSDCRILFTDDYYRTAFKNANEEFAGMVEYQDILNDRMSGNVIRATKFSTNEIADGNGRMRKVAQYFRPNITLYSIEILKNKKDEHGVRFLFFTYINNHWVLFPFN